MEHSAGLRRRRQLGVDDPIVDPYGRGSPSGAAGGPSWATLTPPIGCTPWLRTVSVLGRTAASAVPLARLRAELRVAGRSLIAAALLSRVIALDGDLPAPSRNAVSHRPGRITALPQALVTGAKPLHETEGEHRACRTPATDPPAGPPSHLDRKSGIAQRSAAAPGQSLSV